MVTQVIVREVLEKAIQKETDSRLLYVDLSQRVSDEAAKDAFHDLAWQEQEHQYKLERYLRGELTGGALSREQAVDYKIAEHLGRQEISPDMKLKDVFLLAANHERLSHSSTLALPRFTPLER